MFLPSEKTHSELISSEVGIWYVRSDTGTAILIKAPEHILKTIIAGSKVELIFGKYYEEGINYLCVGLTIHDDPISPIAFFQLHADKEEFHIIHNIFNLGQTPIFLFNEMDISVAHSSLTIIDNKKLNEFLKKDEKYYFGKEPSNIEKIFDSFQISLDESCTIENTSKIPILKIDTSIKKWNSSNIHFVGFNESHEVSIFTDNEGEDFERKLWFTLDTPFGDNLYKSAYFEKGGNQKELTDILAFYEHGVFLIEAKNLAINTSVENRSFERKLSGIKKQIVKAIKQLQGASSTLKKGEDIFDNTNAKNILLNRDIPFHCIVIVSEIVHSGDWSNIENMLIDAFKKTNSMFHVLDFQEFMLLLKASNGEKMLLDYNLMMRFELFMKTKSIHIRSKIAEKN